VGWSERERERERGGVEEGKKKNRKAMEEADEATANAKVSQ